MSYSESRKSRTIRAFTLMEVLVVIAIIAVVAALTYPMLGKAKMSALESTTISNLRQCGIALAMYEPETNMAPAYGFAKIALQSAPTRDPADYYMNQGTPFTKPPLIGSYAYVRGATPLQDDGEMQSVLNEAYDGGAKRYPLMASIWHGKPRLTIPDPPLWEPWNGPFDDERIKKCLRERTCILPDRISYLMSDGSSFTRQFRRYGSNNDNPVFIWFKVFFPPRPFSDLIR